MRRDFPPDPLWIQTMYVRQIARTMAMHKAKGNSTDTHEFLCPYCKDKDGYSDSRKKTRPHAALFQVGKGADRHYWFKCQRCETSKPLRTFLKEQNPAMYQAFVNDVRKHERDTDTSASPGETLLKESGQRLHERFGSPASIDTAGFPMTDQGNGEAFAALYKDSVRYDANRGRWMLWDKHFWKPDTANAVSQLAVSMARKRRDDAVALADTDKQRSAQLYKWALSSESSAKLHTALVRGAAQPELIENTWDTHPMLLGTPNGAVINLDTGTYRTPTTADAITMMTHASYDAAATCPRWERFIDEIFGGDAALVHWIHKAVGYSFTGDTGEHVFFLCHGKGSNGKSTFYEVLMSVLGDYALTLSYQTFAANTTTRWDLAKLPGKRFVVLSEVPESSYTLDSAAIKGLVAGDPQRAADKYEKSFAFVPIAKLWMMVNHKPTIKDDSHGMWRRVKLIPFLQTFPVDKTLKPALKAEAAGILNWCIRGAQLWRAEGLVPEPDCVTAATQQYRQDQDVLGDFIAQECVIGAGQEAKSSKLYDRYKAWAFAEGISKPMSLTAFGTIMGERYTRDPRRDGRIYRGIGLKSAGEASKPFTV